MYCHIAVNAPLGKGVLTYEQIDESLAIGDLVEVPLGRRKAKGCVIGIKVDYDSLDEKTKSFKLRPHGEVLGYSFLLNDLDLKLFSWMSEYYHYSMGQLIFDCLPKPLKRPRKVEMEMGEGLIVEHEFNEGQKGIWEKLKAKNQNSFIKEYIHGVTGSGKTLIYTNLILQKIKEGNSVLFLIPEINLTPQFIETFKKYLPCKVLSYHSGLSASEKLSRWVTLNESTEPVFVMGVRSSVFLPIKKLGLVIVDEEHDSSFKQSDRCTYNGRDVAIKKAQLANCPVVLGSATPSLENYAPESENFYQLKNRVSGHFPKVETISIRDFPEWENPSWPVHGQAIEEMKKSFEKGEQVLVFVSRLGFASYIQCSGCGHKFIDPETETNLRYFKNRNILKSSYSEFQMPVPEICPECGNMHLLQKGFGTEKVQEVLQDIFPERTIGRFDRDDIKNFTELNERLDDFSSGKIDVLVGTQMLSKGHNFEKVNLVVVLGIDSQLNFPDFRAMERTYQLLVQVAGRAGRYSKDSKVIIQTMNEESDLFRYVDNPASDEFFESELAVRQITNFPPVSKTAAIFFSARDREQLLREVIRAKDFLSSVNRVNKLGVQISPPAPVGIEKRAGQFTWTIFIQSKEYKARHLLIQTFADKFDVVRGVTTKIDVDPYYYL